MPQGTRTYGHFCVLARALERVGDRWTLLVVRDLLAGPRRFTDLAELLGGITPKTLSDRLKMLEADGLVEVDRKPGRREVWYRLTPVGRELRPALDALARWGVRHATRGPEPGEQVHPEHTLSALRMALHEASTIRRPLSWNFHFTDDAAAYSLAFDGDVWTLSLTTSKHADVVVRTTRTGWIRFLGTPAEERAASTGVELQGARAAVQTFLRAIQRFTSQLRTTA